MKCPKCNSNIDIFTSLNYGRLRKMYFCSSKECKYIASNYISYNSERRIMDKTKINILSY